MNIYTVKTIKSSLDGEFKQLVELIKKFAIYIYIVQKYELFNKSNNKEEIIEDYKSILKKEELEELKNDIKNRILFAEKSLSKVNNKKSTKYYTLFYGEKMIGFQTAQIRFENNSIEGWRNFAYIETEFAGKSGIVRNINKKETVEILSNALYKNITDWFKENDVKIEKTATGKAMRKNILVYIVNKGFIPIKEDNQKVYLIKDYSKKISKCELKKIYKEYVNNGTLQK